LEKNDSVLSLRISIVVIMISLFLFSCTQQLHDLQGQQEAIAQQKQQQQQLQPPQQQEGLTQRVPLGSGEGGIFTAYTNPKYGFSLLYPSDWIYEEIPPGANVTFLISFHPPPREFGEFVFVDVAVRN
jgi:hypothetical protein